MTDVKSRRTAIAKASKANLTRAAVHSLLSTAFEFEDDERFLQDAGEIERTFILTESQTGNELREASGSHSRFAEQSKDPK